jgi:hypothetical protein
MYTTPSRSSRRVELTSGHDSTNSPSKKAQIAQDHATRIIGEMNIMNPLLIASGGMMIALLETGTRVSRTRQKSIAMPPKTGPMRSTGRRIGW